MIATMRDVPPSLNPLRERAGQVFSCNTIVSRLSDGGEDRLPRAAPACRRTARPDAARAACSGPGRADALASLRITDRTKDLIESGGEWIGSVELENARMAHPVVAEAAVIAIPDPKWSARPLACLVLKPGQSLDLAEMGAHLTQQGVAKWQWPGRCERIDASPRTCTGRLWKLKLREMFPR